MLKLYQKSRLIILFVCFLIVIFGGLFITSNQCERVFSKIHNTKKIGSNDPIFYVLFAMFY